MSVYETLIRNNDIETIKVLIQTSKNVSGLDPSINSNEALHAACNYANKEIIGLLLDDSRVSQTIKSKELFFMVPNVEIAELLLNDSRINIDDDFCAIFDYFRSNTKIMEVLLNNTKINLDTKSDELLVNAALHSVTAFKILLSNPKIKPKESFDDIIRKIIAHIKGDLVHGGLINISRLILSDPRIDPVCVQNAPIAIASFFGFNDIVAKLLSDERVDPRMSESGSFDVNFPINTALQSGWVHTTTILAMDSRINLDECAENCSDIEMKQLFVSIKESLETKSIPEEDKETKSIPEEDKETKSILEEDKETKSIPAELNNMIQSRECYKVDPNRTIFMDHVACIGRINEHIIDFTMDNGNSFLMADTETDYQKIVSMYNI